MDTNTRPVLAFATDTQTGQLVIVALPPGSTQNSGVVLIQQQAKYIGIFVLTMTDEDYLECLHLFKLAIPAEVTGIVYLRDFNPDHRENG